jgi:hypothetical protein
MYTGLKIKKEKMQKVVDKRAEIQVRQEELRESIKAIL